MSADDDLLKEAREEFTRASDAEDDNRKNYLDDVRFAREGQQWDSEAAKMRAASGRPCLTINKLEAFIRQVVNDGRQNKPSIHVHPADSNADPDTADLVSGLIRNIEYTSDADIAYDTATECAVSGGFGYFRIGLDQNSPDSEQKDLSIRRVANPLSIYGDPNSTAADSSDWDVAFVVDQLGKRQYEAQYGSSENHVDWDDTDAWSEVGPWRTMEGGEEAVLIAEYWKREEVTKKYLALSDGRVIEEAQLVGKDADPDLVTGMEVGLFKPVRQFSGKGKKVTQTIMSGVEVISRREWPGMYIPIVPVYGLEFNIKGKRYLRSLIHNAKDAQMMFNVWRSTSTELVGLAPKTPWIGPTGAFESDQDRWQTANTKNHAFLEYDGVVPPQRIPLDSGPAAGAMQEALNASDDMKSVIGMYDASLGARSNETSGKAIMARQREGDVSTFHFQDNMARAIRHAGRILIDLIPKVYTGERMVRIMGEDGKAEVKQLGKEYPKVDPKTGQPLQQPSEIMGPDGNPLMKPIMALHDLSAGKYDLTVQTGPSFTTRREEAAASMTELIRAFPAAAPIVGPELAKNLDWPGADKIAEKMEAMTEGQIPPEVQKAIEEGKQQIAQLTEENQKLKMDQAADMAKVQADQAANQQKIEAQQLADQAAIASKERLAMIEIESNERIAIARIRSEALIKSKQAEMQAQNAAEANRMKAEQPRPQA